MINSELHQNQHVQINSTNFKILELIEKEAVFGLTHKNQKQPQFGGFSKIKKISKISRLELNLNRIKKDSSVVRYNAFC